MIKKKLISFEKFILLDSNGNCYYLKEMLDNYNFIKKHDGDIVKEVNNVSSLTKESTSSVETKKAKFISNIGELKKIINYIFYVYCLESSEKTICDFNLFKKFIKEADKNYIFKDIKNNAINAIEINNTVFINKNNFISIIMNSFEADKKTNISVLYKNGIMKELSFDPFLKKMNVGFIEADNFSGDGTVNNAVALLKKTNGFKNGSNDNSNDNNFF